MKHPSDDIDIATSASTDQIQTLFPKTIPVGINFGIVVVVINNHSFEVATFRKDQGYVDGRRPVGIEKASPEQDAQRRDFTINGMFYDPVTETLYDYVEGQKDLAHKLVCAIGNPHERFLEDRLRMIRGIRYAARFNFTIHEETMAAIDIHAHTLFPSVAIERVVHEFEKMHRFSQFDKALLMLHKHYLLPTIFPPLKDIPLDEIKRRVQLIHQLPHEVPLILKLLELFPDFALEKGLQLCDHLKLSNKEREAVSFLYTVKATPFTADDYTWAHLYANPLFPLLLSFFKDDHSKRLEALAPFITRIQESNPLIDATTLIKHGMKPGKALGEALKEGERHAINHHITDPNAILKHLRCGLQES
jgi:poly(A) polymerase